MDGNTILKNTTFNLAGKIFPLLIGILCIPFVIKGLGITAFGLLSLIWVLLGYFSLFDLGMGQATTKFIAQTLARDQHEKLPSLVWSSLISHLFLGILGSIVIALLLPFVIEQAFTIPDELIASVKWIGVILTCAVPVVMINSSLRGILEGAQRYSDINVVKVFLNSAMFLIPATSFFFPLGLEIIVFLLVLIQMMGAYWYTSFIASLFPGIFSSFAWSNHDIRSLFSLGSWIGISNILLTLLVTGDRFFIASLISIGIVGFYTAPFDVVARLLIIPESLIVLFPIVAALHEHKKERVLFFYRMTLKHLLFIMGSIALVLIFLGDDILRLWLGTEFQEKSLLVFQLLCIGIVALGTSLIGENVLKGLGKPQRLVILRVVELGIYLPLLWFAAGAYGIIGVAWLWLARSLVDAVIIFFLTQRAINASQSSHASLFGIMVLLFAQGVYQVIIAQLLSGPFIYIFMITGYVTIILIWYAFFLEHQERTVIKSFLLKKP